MGRCEIHLLSNRETSNKQFVAVCGDALCSHATNVFKNPENKGDSSKFCIHC